MKVIKRILIIILLIIIFIVAGFVYKGHELYKQALEKISISDKVAELLWKIGDFMSMVQ